jgi:hypothetical protein
MILRNKELKQAFGLCLGAGSVTVPIAFLIDRVTGLSVLLCWGLWGFLLWFIEWRRYSALQQISRDLDALLLHGTALPIGRYEEGELSLLADQVQKLTRKLTEARDALQKDKTFPGSIRNTFTIRCFTCEMMHEDKLQLCHVTDVIDAETGAVIARKINPKG